MNAHIRIKHKSVFLITLLTSFFYLSLSSAIHAEEYPSKPIISIVPYGAGGGTDSFARTLSTVAYDVLGQPMVVVNRPGGNGYVGGKYAAAAKNDGHTIMIQSAGSFMLGGMVKKQPVDLFEDFEPVSVIGQLHTGIVVNADSPYKKIEDLIAAAKDKKLTWAHAGRGGVHHMAGSAFEIKHGFTTKDIPYKGGGNVRNALLGGQVDFAWVGVQQVAGFEDQLRVLGIANNERDPVQNSFKTFAELGIDYTRFVSPITVFVPKGTDKAKIEKLADAVKQMQGQKAFKKLSKSAGLAVMYKGPAESEKYLRELKSQWEPVVAAVLENMKEG